MPRAVLATGNTHAEEVESLVAHGRFAALRILEPRVAPIDDDVSLLEQRSELLEHRVHRGARLNHHHDPSRPLQCADELR